MTEIGSSSYSSGLSQDASVSADSATAPSDQSRTRRRRTDRMVVASGELQHAIDLASGLARSNDTVLISGPSGSGRRHLARAFHGWSPQAQGPFIELGVGGLPESDQSTALFGDDRSLGAIREAAGGVLVVLEAELLAPSVRERISTTLRDHQVHAGADDSSRATGTRIVATVGAGIESPFPNIPVKSIVVPSLADRKEDILPLASHFLAEFALEKGVEAVGFTSDAAQALFSGAWTGNVRELRSRIRQAVNLSGGGAVSVESLMLANETDEVLSFKEAKRAFETRYVEGLLRRCSGNISRAARMAKKDRKDFYDVIRRTGVEPSLFRS